MQWQYNTSIIWKAHSYIAIHSQALCQLMIKLWAWHLVWKITLHAEHLPMPKQILNLVVTMTPMTGD